MNKIFDLTDTSDLPFKVGKPKTIQEKIQDLLILAGEPVTNDQLRAAFYRAHKVTLSKTQVSARISCSISEGLVKRVGTGTYQIKENPEAGEKNAL